MTQMTPDKATVADYPKPDLPSSYGLFSGDPIFYGFGTSISDYTTIILLTGIIILGFFITKFGRRYRLAGISLMTGPISYLIMVALMHEFLMGEVESVRYVIPVILAFLGVGLALILHLGGRCSPLKSSIPMRCLSVIASGIILLNFMPSMTARTIQLHNYGSANALIWFSASPQIYKTWTEQAFSGRTRLKLESAQDEVPEGQKLMVWTQATHFTNYVRHEIVDFGPAGLASPWLDYPFSANIRSQIDYLVERDIHYFLYQHSGIPTRTPEDLFLGYTAHFDNQYNVACRLYLFMKSLDSMVNQPDLTEVIYEDNLFRVIRLKSIEDRKD
jgi:hypothetical protein